MLALEGFMSLLLKKTELIIWKSDFKPQKPLNIQNVHIKTTVLQFGAFFSLKEESCVSTCTQ